MLVEYGEQHLDLGLRFKVHALMQWLHDQHLDGIRELTPGVRSLQIHYNPQVISAAQLVEQLTRGEERLRSHLNELKVPSRIVHLLILG
ncbi:carboxyltransferase domain-containing protein [Nitrincola nitratireducens]